MTTRLRCCGHITQPPTAMRGTPPASVDRRPESERSFLTVTKRGRDQQAFA